MKECFAGGNTRTGFVNYLPDLLEGKTNIWLLKGCPGSGKSSFLKKMAALAEKEGFEVTAIRCSSDTDSLDGIVVPKASFVAVDATAPHVITPKYPVAVHKEINMASFTHMGHDDAKEIIALSDEKAKLYDMAYAYLFAAGALRDALRKSIMPHVLYGKLLSFAARRVKGVKGAGKTAHLQRTALGKYGVQQLNTFDGAKKIISFGGDTDLTDVFMDAVLSFSKGKECYASYDVIDAGRVSEVYFPKEKLLFTANGGDEVNTARFITAEGLKETRPLRRYVKKQCVYLSERASELISRAAVLHGDMEKIYVAATDFDLLNRYEDELTEELLEVLNS